MICVKMDGSRLTVRGHAGYGKPGEDVVCAAASALVYALIGTLRQKDRIRELTSRPGYVDVAAAGDAEEAMAVVRCGLEQLASQYGAWVKMEE